MARYVNNPIEAESERTGYPFISVKGTTTIISDAVDNIVLYITPETPLPISVFDVSMLSPSTLRMRFSDAEGSIFASAEYIRGVPKSVLRNRGAILGKIEWNIKGADSLSAAVLGGLIPKDGDILVIPELCIPMYLYSPTAVSVDGRGIPYGTSLTFSHGIYLSRMGGNTFSVSSVESPPSSDGAGGGEYDPELGINGNKIALKEISWVGISEPSVDIVADKPIDVWFKSQATCDLRVTVDSDTIIIKGVSDDSI